MIRIARLSRDASGAYASEPHFIPPSLSLEASGYLLVVVRRLIETLAGKASSLSAKRKQKSRSQADFSTGRCRIVLASSYHQYLSA